jgi:endo-1,4-beta-xylanase
MKHYLVIPLICLMNCATTKAPGQEVPALKDVFKKDFLMGAAINEADTTEPAAVNCEVALIQKHFNSISPENVLKWESIHPAPDKYNFGSGDRYVEFGVKNGMFIIGHNLVWHRQTPAWVFQDQHGTPLSREALLRRMHDHIFTVVSRYKGRIGGWDVVNEAVDEDGSMRQSPWLKIIGEDYVLKAFQFAHEADPNAQLYYNDFSLEDAPKRTGAIALLKKLQAQGAPIVGIGLQGHYRMDWPALHDVDETIEAFARLGFKVMITELDVSVLRALNRTLDAEVSPDYQLRAEDNPYTNGLPDAMQQALAARYAGLFKVFVKHRDQITRVTFWGVTDGNSWLNYWPVRGRIDYPFLFGRGCGAKSAFDAVVEVGRGKGSQAGNP